MQLNSREFGDPGGAPVLCLHGLTGYGGRFRSLAEAYLQTRRVVAFDLRGHGFSGWEPPWDLDTHVDDLVETAGSLGIESADWIGHSIGGRLIAHLAARAPGLVGRAVLLDPAMRVSVEAASQRVEVLRADVSFATPDEAIDTRLADPTLFSTPRSTLEAEAKEHLERGEDGRYRWRYYPPMAIVAWSEMVTPAPPWPACPTLLVAGAQTWFEFDTAGAPHLERVTVPGGHSVLWDAFPETAEAVARFLG